jgi:diguanylate cyclase (GGDEF)-like protein
MPNRIRPSIGLNESDFQRAAYLDRTFSARRFLWRSSLFASLGLLIFWGFDVYVSQSLALESLAVRAVGAVLLLLTAFFAARSASVQVIEVLLIVPPAVITLAVALAAQLSGVPSGYSSGVALMFCLSAAWLVRRRTFFWVNLLLLLAVALIGYHWQRQWEWTTLLMCLLGFLCGALYFDFLARLNRRALRLRLELKTESRTDALTGVPNRRAFMELAEDAWQRAHRRGKALAVLLIDADNFKQVNDTHGHDVGDAVLQALAAAIANTMANPNDCGRLGGEEFAVLLQDMSLQQAHERAEQLRAAVQRYDWALEKLPSMSISIGLAYLPAQAKVQTGRGEPEGSFSELLRQADAALYRAKQQGRNCVALAASVADAPEAIAAS